MSKKNGWRLIGRVFPPIRRSEREAMLAAEIDAARAEAAELGKQLERANARLGKAQE